MRLVYMVLILTGLASLCLAQEKTTLAGYGELHYNKITSGAPLAQSVGKLDFHRFVIFFGHQFNSWISFHSELEVEHSLLEGNAATGKLALEQAYVQLQYHKAIGVRAGIILIPVGIINPIHEPPSFNGVERPNVEKYIIPTTWRESGIGITGALSPSLSYEAYLMAGLDVANLSGKDGIRPARQVAFNSRTEDFALTARINYFVSLNLQLVGSVFYSTLEKSTTYGDDLSGAAITMFEAHALYTRGNFKARGLAVVSSISGSGKINALFDAAKVASPEIGSGQFGAYLEGAYDVLGMFLPESEQRLFAFARYETYNTQSSTDGFQANPEYERQEITLGLTYLPHPTVSMKADFQFLNNAGNSDTKQFNLGMGYNF